MLFFERLRQQAVAMANTKKYDWQSNIKINIVMLRLLGMWPEDEKYEGFYRLYAIWAMTFLLVGNLVFQSVNIYFIRDNLEAVTGTIYVLLIEMLVAFKTFYVIGNMATFKRLLKVLDIDSFQPKSAEQKRLITMNIRSWKIIYRIFWAMCLGCNVFWAIYPLVDKSAGERRLPFMAWYPYNTKESPFYELTYIYQVFSVSFTTTIHVNMDTLVAALNVFNSIQLDILCDNLKNLHNIRGSVDLAANLIGCVEHHKETLRFAKRCNNFLNWFLLLQFIVFGVAIGLTMFQLSVLVPFSNEFLSLLSYGCALTVQLFMYCWFGNEVEIKSSNIPYSVFESEWMDFPADVKKNVLFFLTRTQTPLRFTALNIMSLSLDNFMKILKTSWSYFALLNQISGRK